MNKLYCATKLISGYLHLENHNTDNTIYKYPANNWPISTNSV